MPGDADLVQAAGAGDVANLGVLLERHRAGMQAVALSLLGYSPAAQDVIQEAMLLALTRLHHLRDPDAVGPRLRAIARNACRKHLRARRSDIVEERAFPDIPAKEPSPEELLDPQVLRDWVRYALEGLSEPLHLAVLRYFGRIFLTNRLAGS